MSEKIEIFGKEVLIKDNICSDDPNKVINSLMKINLFISITDVCVAKCPFCNNNTKQECVESNLKFDTQKLISIIKELKQKKYLNRISFTGGEPCLNLPLLDEVIGAVYSVCGKENEITINTNGVNLRKIVDLKNVDKITGVHISRHHYSDEINDSIFGFRTAHKEDIEYVINNCENKKLIRLNCLLIKNFIDSPEKVTEFLEFASTLNIFRVGFVGLMPINQYSKDHFVEYKDIISKMNDNCYFADQKYNKDICDCCNSVYLAKNGKLVEFYARTVRKLNEKVAGQFNYSADNHLKAGFDNIIL